MADSWKAMDLNRFVVKDDMIDYVLHKYGVTGRSDLQVHNAISLTHFATSSYSDLIEKRIEKVGQHLNKEKQIMHINKGKEKMMMEKEVIIIESNTSYDYFPAQNTSDEGSDHNPFQATSDESSNHNPFQVTSDETSDDSLKSSSEDTCSSDCTWEQKKASKSKGSTCTTLVVPTKRPPPVTNCVLGIAAVTTWQRILNKEFGIISSKEDVGGSSNVRSKGKRKML
ncbi:hypothetical protein Tco_0453380 [Tanacetum coccineum]